MVGEPPEGAGLDLAAWHHCPGCGGNMVEVLAALFARGRPWHLDCWPGPDPPAVPKEDPCPQSC